jgi:hypothetical protein
VKGVRVLLLVGFVVVVSLIAGAYAAGREVPRLTAAEARTFAVQALTDSGARPVEPSGEPRAETFTPVPEGEEEVRIGEEEEAPPADPIPVWVVPLRVANQPIELYVAQSGGRAVNLDDALPDGGFVLNEEQFDRLERFRLDLAGDRVRAQRQGPSLVAGLLIGLVAVGLLVSVVTRRVRAARTDDG